MRYRPEVMVLEDCGGASSRRHARIQRLLDEIRRVVCEKRIAVADFTPARVRRVSAPKKDVIAASIAGRFPDLAT